MILSLWRTMILFLIIMFCLRFMGKRQIGELQPSELVTTVIISNIAAIPIENIRDPLLNDVAAILLIALMEVLLSAWALKSPRMRKIAVGQSRQIITNGILNQELMRELRWSLDDLEEQLHSLNIFDLSEVQEAIIETNGSLSVLQKFPYRTATNEDLGLSPSGSAGPARLIVKDGVLDRQELTLLNLNERWLEGILEREAVSLSQVFVLSSDSSAAYHLIRKGQPL